MDPFRSYGVLCLVLPAAAAAVNSIAVIAMPVVTAVVPPVTSVVITIILSPTTIVTASSSHGLKFLFCQLDGCYIDLLFHHLSNLSFLT
jgi:hypothetical protein